jgi:hypothetical protein
MLATGLVRVFKYGLSHITCINVQNLPIEHKFSMSRLCIEGFIALMDKNKTTISIINLDKINDVPLVLNNKTNEYFFNMIFYPKRSILAIMSRNKKNEKTFMRYWNVAKQQYITTTELSGGYFPCFFYFSYSGKKIILPYWENSETYKTIGSFISNVPFKVRYQDGTQEKFLYLSCVLNHIAPTMLDGKILPQDILNYIKKNYLRLCK